jgi:hypothetical protein
VKWASHSRGMTRKWSALLVSLQGGRWGGGAECGVRERISIFRVNWKTVVMYRPRIGEHEAGQGRTERRVVRRIEGCSADNEWNGSCS